MKPKCMIYLNVNIFIEICLCMHEYLYAYIYICYIYLFLYTYTYVYIYIYIYAYIISLKYNDQYRSINLTSPRCQGYILLILFIYKTWPLVSILEAWTSRRHV